jgi:hypothetical protein
VREHLPLFGGRPASDLADMLTEGGFLDVERELLMDAVLCGVEPERERCALLGRLPAFSMKPG